VPEPNPRWHVWTQNYPLGSAVGYVPSVKRAIIVRGRPSGPRRIDLDEDVDDLTGDVEVVVRAVSCLEATPHQDVFEFLRSLPVGQRSKAEIDQQLAEERDAWGDRSAGSSSSK